MQTTFNLVFSLLLTKLCLDAATYCSALYQLFRQPETESRSVSTNMLINFALMLASAILAAWGGVAVGAARVADGAGDCVVARVAVCFGGVVWRGAECDFAAAVKWAA